VLSDALIDTNVFAHASNPGVQYYEDSKSFLNAFRACNTLLCIDGDNGSLIAKEYSSQLHSGMLGFAVLVHLAQTRRVKTISRKVTPQQARQVKLLKLKKPRDETFVRVALNSDESIFVSHDFQDFPQQKRATIMTDLGVDIVDAAEGRSRL